MKQRTRLMHGGDDMISCNMSKTIDGDNNSEIQLHKMRPQEHFIEAQVQESDTLQAIALRFYCSISELKRINHIHKDNEIFARRTIKVPVTPYSVLTEIMATVEPTEAAPSPSSYPPTSTSQDLFAKNTHNEVQNLQNKNTEVKDDFAIDCNDVILNSTLAPAVTPYTDTEMNDPVSEDTQLLPHKPRDSVETVVVKQLTSQGADFGIKWYHLVCCMLVLGVVIPLVYVMFYLDIHSDHNPAQLNSTADRS